MNEKTGKILKWGILGGLALFLGIKFVKSYKKGMEEIENQEFQETEDLENAGVDTGKLREEIKDDEKDFTKMLYTATRFNSDIDLDLIALKGDVMTAKKGALECIDAEVIHVRQVDTMTKHGETRRKLEFLIEMQDWFSQSFRNPKIGSYFKTFKEAAVHMSREIVKFAPEARHTPVGFVVISREINDDVAVEYREIKKDIFSPYADGKHDGLTEFYKIEKTRFGQLGPQKYTDEYSDWVFKNCPDLNKEDPTFLVEDLIMMYRISFQIRSNQPGELLGVDVKTAIKCIKYLTEEMSVQREGAKPYQYSHLLFHAPDPDTGEPSLVWYYTVDDNEKVIIDNDGIFYERTE